MIVLFSYQRYSYRIDIPNKTKRPDLHKVPNYPVTLTVTDVKVKGLAVSETFSDNIRKTSEI